MVVKFTYSAYNVQAVNNLEYIVYLDYSIYVIGRSILHKLWSQIVYKVHIEYSNKYHWPRRTHQEPVGHSGVWNNK